VGDEVKRGNGFRDVERLGVGHGRNRYQTDVPSRGCDAGRHQHGVGTAGQAPRVDLLAAAGLGHQSVIDGEEVKQPAFGHGRQAGPVAATGDRLGGAGRLPRPRVPAVTVQGDREVQICAHVPAFSNAIGWMRPRPHTTIWASGRSGPTATNRGRFTAGTDIT
jgi:hypothetical protein